MFGVSGIVSFAWPFSAEGSGRGRH